jgi:hypothetical protein
LEITAKADGEIAALRTAALIEYRDRLRETRLEISKVEAAENWQHRLYRFVFRKVRPGLSAPTKLEPLISGWRKPPGYGAAGNAADDPTVRKLADVIASQSPIGP